jgi:hypothetical protein
VNDLHTAAMVVALILGWLVVIFIGGLLLWLALDFTFKAGKRFKDKE